MPLTRYFAGGAKGGAKGTRTSPSRATTTSTYDWSPLVVIRLEPIDITRLRG